MVLNQSWVEVPTAAGSMECFLAHPAVGGPYPPVVLYMDAPGVREELCGFVRRMAAEGFCAIMPNLYYQQPIWVEPSAFQASISAHQASAERSGMSSGFWFRPAMTLALFRITQASIPIDAGSRPTSRA